MRFKRSEILRAIRQEPLGNGHFILPKNDNGEDDAWGGDVYNNKCKVCAVGAVLRQKGVPDNKINERAGTALINPGQNSVDETGDWREALEEKNYLVALSIKFEKLAMQNGTGKKTRKLLSEFVKRYFPLTFTQKI